MISATLFGQITRFQTNEAGTSVKYNVDYGTPAAPRKGQASLSGDAAVRAIANLGLGDRVFFFGDEIEPVAWEFEGKNYSAARLNATSFEKMENGGFFNANIIGNLGQPLELRSVANSKTGELSDVTDMNIASNRIYIDANGKRHTEVSWLKSSAWRKLAQNAVKYLGKGSKVFVEAIDVQAEHWISKEDGSLRSGLTSRSNKIQYLDPAPTKGGEVPMNDQAAPAPEPLGEDIPF